jgi:hypothetical protein
MVNRVAGTIGAVALAALAYGCEKTEAPTAPAGVKPQFTPASNAQSTLLGVATFGDPDGELFKVKRITGDWHFELKAKSAFDLAVSHPGPVLIQVLSGVVTFYEADDPSCTPIIRSAGEAYLDLGEHPHIARNESEEVAENLVTAFVPPGAPARIDADAPGNCPF